MLCTAHTRENSPTAFSLPRTLKSRDPVSVRVFLLFFPHAFTLGCRAVGVVEQPLEDGVGESGFADGFKPVIGG